MIFGYEFNSDAEMPEQMQLYFEQLDEEDGVPTEAEVTYIRDKALNVILKTEEIDELLNTNTKGWKTSRMNKVDLSILRLAVYEMKWDDEVPTGVAIDQAVELAKKYGLPDEVVHAIAAHHDDIEPTTPEAVIVKICDAMSAARPGARNISAENFAERMRDLENIATSFPGIDKAYAISAGREIRVIVEPKQIDDLSALKLARDIANKIEATMSYPGIIKVNVIRETRAVEYAK